MWNQAKSTKYVGASHEQFFLLPVSPQKVSNVARFTFYMGADIFCSAVDAHHTPQLPHPRMAWSQQQKEKDEDSESVSFTNAVFIAPAVSE